MGRVCQIVTRARKCSWALQHQHTLIKHLLVAKFWGCVCRGGVRAGGDTGVPRTLGQPCGEDPQAPVSVLLYASGTSTTVQTPRSPDSPSHTAAGYPAGLQPLLCQERQGCCSLSCLPLSWQATSVLETSGWGPAWRRGAPSNELLRSFPPRVLKALQCGPERSQTKPARSRVST